MYESIRNWSHKAQACERSSRMISRQTLSEIGSGISLHSLTSSSAKMTPQTVANYLSHLGAVFAICQASLGIPTRPERDEGTPSRYQAPRRFRRRARADVAHASTLSVIQWDALARGSSTKRRRRLVTTKASFIALWSSGYSQAGWQWRKLRQMRQIICHRLWCHLATSSLANATISALPISEQRLFANIIRLDRSAGPEPSCDQFSDRLVLHSDQSPGERRILVFQSFERARLGSSVSRFSSQADAACFRSKVRPRGEHLPHA